MALLLLEELTITKGTVTEIHKHFGDSKTLVPVQAEIETVGNPEKRLIPWDDYVNAADHLLSWLFRQVF